MGATDAKLWYYPANGGYLHEIDMGEPLSDLPERRIDFVDTGSSSAGETTVLRRGALTEVNIVNERITDEALIAELQSFEAHAKAGRPFGLAADASKAWASYASGVVKQTDGTLKHGGNVFTPYDGINSMANVYVVIESMPPLSLWEKCKATTTGTSNVMTLDSSTPIRYNHEQGPVFIRHETFFPVLYLAPSQYDRPIITHDHRRNWTLNFTAWTSPAAIYALYTETGGIGINYLSTDDQPVAVEGTLQEVIDKLIGESTTTIETNYVSTSTWLK